MSEIKYDTIIIGGGAAGLMAAYASIKQGQRTLLLEKMEKCARKVRITGKGRCNITNDTSIEAFIEKVRSGGEFIAPALRSFPPSETMRFFAESDFKLTVERGGRVFPTSGSAFDVAAVMIRKVERAGVEIIYHAEVSQINITTDNSSERRVAGVTATVNGKRTEYQTSKVIVATGGASYPGTGSTGDGYTFAYECGHTIVPVRPSLVSLDLDSPYLNDLAGVQLKNINLKLLVDGSKVQSEFGEMEFYDYGIGGAITLRCSRKAVDALIDNSKVEVEIDLKPALSEAKLLGRIARELEANAALRLRELLRKLLPAQMIACVVPQVKMQSNVEVRTLAESDLKMIISVLKGLQFRVSDYGGFSEAIVTAGGVSLDEVNPETMESLKVKGLYLAGEVLDIDADTGGYNLQLAFSSGYLAGRS